jgi:anti-sigma regulatory factor (Ser/Thr protein kinase)
MEIKELILKTLNEKGEVKASEIVEASGFSRMYVNRFFRELRGEGVLTLVGKANTAKYIPANREAASTVIGSIKNVYRILRNIDLSEDEVLSDIRKGTGIFHGLPDNISGILDYAFTEILNNAIEHSGSQTIEVRMERKPDRVIFEIRDKGVGIFINIMKKKNLDSEKGAIQDLLKGKQTTEPASHSGEGIFFTSKVGDIFTIQSSGKKLIFDNLIKDIFLSDVNGGGKGTKVIFSISLDSKTRISDIFSAYTDDSFQFTKTEVTIKLYEEDANYVSRSQARRLLSGLEKFNTIILDFKGIDTIGQAFADEIFRVWKDKYPGKDIVPRNAGENAAFMIKRAMSL